MLNAIHVLDPTPIAKQPGYGEILQWYTDVCCNIMENSIHIMEERPYVEDVCPHIVSDTPR